MRLYSFLAILLLFTSFSYGQEGRSIIFIFDASGSMWGQIEGQTKHAIATNVLNQTVQSFEEDQSYGLVVYGHRQEKDCEDVETVIPLTNTSKTALEQSLVNVKPLGRTPLAFSALKVIEEIKNSSISATVILITDGIESCGGNLCEVIKEAKKAGVDFKLHIVGFGLKDSESKDLLCAVEEGGGNYYDAQNAESLSNALEEVTELHIKEESKNLSVFAYKNEEPLDAGVRAYPKGEKSYVTSTRTYRDTGFLSLTPGVYDLEIYPLENSDISAITVPDVTIPDEGMVHRDVSFDGGIIRINSTNNGEGWDAVVHINRKNDGKSVSGGRTYGSVKDYEVSPGKYTVKLVPMRIKGLGLEYIENDVTVVAKESTEVSHNFESGMAWIGAESKGTLIDVVVNIVDPESGRSVAGGRTYRGANSNPADYLIAPGTYEVTLKGLRDFSGVNKTFVIKIEAGKTVRKTTEF